MACGVGLGFFMICIFQAERVGCLASQGQTDPRLNNQYVGYLQQDSRLSHLDGSYPQNRLRQAWSAPRSAQSSSLNSQIEANSGYSQGQYTKMQTLSKPTYSSHSSAKSVMFSKPDWQNNQYVNEPKKQFQLAEVASGASVFQTGPKKQSAPLTGYKQYSLPWPKKSDLRPASQQVVPRTLQGTAVNPPAQYSKPKEDYRFGLDQMVKKGPARMKTSVSSPGRRVTKKTKLPKLHSSIPKGTSRDFGSNLTPNYQPRSSSLKSNQNPTQKAQHFSAYRNAAGGRFAPSETFNIPERFGGYAIRRVKSPKKPAAKNPSRVVAAPQPSRQQPSRVVAAPQPSRVVAAQQPSRVVASQQPSRRQPSRVVASQQPSRRQPSRVVASQQPSRQQPSRVVASQQPSRVAAAQQPSRVALQTQRLQPPTRWKLVQLGNQ